MVIVPSRKFGNLLVTDWTETVLFFPERDELPFSLQVVHHLDAQAFFKVPFPCWVVRVRIPFDFSVPLYGNCVRVEELDVLCGSILFLYLPTKHPVPLSDGMEVFIFHPSSGFVWMPSFGPLPECSEDRIIHFHKGLFARYMPMIVCPAPDFGVELYDQVSGCRLSIFLEKFSDLGKKCLDVFLGRFYQNFSIFVFPYVLT
jgi:hypothetical protein